MIPRDEMTLTSRRTLGGKLSKWRKNYFAEAPEVYEQFLKHYDIPKK